MLVVWQPSGNGYMGDFHGVPLGRSPLPADRKPTPPPRVLTTTGRTLDGKLYSYLKVSGTFPQSITRPMSDLLFSPSAFVELWVTLYHKAACPESPPPRSLSSTTWTRCRLAQHHRAGLSSFAIEVTPNLSWAGLPLLSLDNSSAI